MLIFVGDELVRSYLNSPPGRLFWIDRGQEKLDKLAHGRADIFQVHLLDYYIRLNMSLGVIIAPERVRLFHIGAVLRQIILSAILEDEEQAFVMHLELFRADKKLIHVEAYNARKYVGLVNLESEPRNRVILNILMEDI